MAINNPFGSTSSANDFAGDPLEEKPDVVKTAENLMNDPTVNLIKQAALNQGKDYIEKHAGGWLSFFSIEGAKVYFDVTNTYVPHKLKILALPFLIPDQEWRNVFSPTPGANLPRDHERNIDYNQLQANDYISPRSNLIAYDLYLPVMGFQTYLIIVGLLYGGREEFSTEKLSYVYSKLLFYWILESAIQKGCFMF